MERAGREANLVWRVFTSNDIPVIWADGEATAFQRDLVADLHTAASAYPRDPGLASLIADLRNARLRHSDHPRRRFPTRRLYGASGFRGCGETRPPPRGRRPGVVGR
ncbi:MmyB family transcriptional regulator [Okibacterium endophyticum]